MSVLTSYFDASVKQCSPVKPDYRRVVNYDKEGNEYITFVEVDYPSFQKSLGCVSDWSLDFLLKAGVNPNFSISTGLPTRLEGISSVAEFSVAAESILSESESSEN